MKEEKKSRKAEKPPKVSRKKTDIIENAGKVFINIGQLIFGTLFLGTVLRGSIPQYIMLMAAFVGALIFISFGLFMSAKEKKE